MSRLIFRAHAIRRMFQRRIAVGDVRRVIETGETIEANPDDLPYPSRLVLGQVGGRPVHVVVAEDQLGDESVVVTVYEPDPALWRPGFRRRRKA